MRGKQRRGSTFAVALSISSAPKRSTTAAVVDTDTLNDPERTERFEGVFVADGVFRLGMMQTLKYPRNQNVGGELRRTF